MAEYMTVVPCDAGRRMTPNTFDTLFWLLPCAGYGDHTLVVDLGGRPTTFLLCRDHIRDLARRGVIEPS